MVTNDSCEEEDHDEAIEKNKSMMKMITMSHAMHQKHITDQIRMQASTIMRAQHQMVS